MSSPDDQPEKESSRKVFLWILIIGLVLLVPVIPFLILGDQFETGLLDFIKKPMSSGRLIGVSFFLLASDIFLPVPSSMVITYSGGVLGTLTATLTGWMGLNAGAFLGYFLSRLLGRPFAEKMAGKAEIEELERLTLKYGPMTILWTRALPILAEAAVLFVGATSLPFRNFWKPIIAANLVVAFCYAAAGGISSQFDLLPLVVIASGLFPLGLAWLIRKYHLKQQSQPVVDNQVEE